MEREPDAFDEGKAAYFDGVDFSANPYAQYTRDWSLWWDGWSDGARDDKSDNDESDNL